MTYISHAPALHRQWWRLHMSENISSGEKKQTNKNKILSLSEPYSGVKQKIFKEIHHFYPQLPPLGSHEMYIFCLPTIQRSRLAQ